MDISYCTTLEWDFCSGVSTLLDLTIRSIIQKSLRDTIIQRRQCRKLENFFNGMHAHITIDPKFRNVKISWNNTKTNRQFVNTGSLTSLDAKIQMRMERYAEKLIQEFRFWKCLTDIIIQYGFNQYYNVDIFNYLDDFIYDSYGGIDYSEMAKKMLTCDKLEKEVRFAIACKFCFEDEIKELWPLVATESLFNDLKIKWSFSLLWYWIAVLTNQLQKIPAHLRGNSIPATMFSRFSHSKSALEFFWKHITTFDDQVYCIGECFRDCKNPPGAVVLSKYWIPRMSDEFLESLISLYGTHMMTSMVMIVLCREFVLPFWQRTCNMYNSDQFATIFVKFSDTKDARIKSLCEQIWNIAPIEFKNHASNCIAAENEAKRLADERENNLINFLRRSGIKI